MYVGAGDPNLGTHDGIASIFPISAFFLAPLGKDQSSYFLPKLRYGAVEMARRLRACPPNLKAWSTESQNQCSSQVGMVVFL